ncbi:MAG: SDR family NAD(P)-dependent oxidoreductase [Lacibacter sp.]
MESVKNKNVLIVGATGGIGSKTAKLLAGSGANLFLAARNKERLVALAAELHLPKSKIFSLDISKPKK